MMRVLGWAVAVCLVFGAIGASAQDAAAAKVIRIGIIGTDTSHVPAFTKLFNDPKATGDLAGFKVVAAFPGGSADIPSSRDRVEGFAKQLKEMGVEIVDSIPALLSKVDAVLLESVDGRPHLEQVRPVFEAGKRVFIDKPLAGSLADAIAIAELGKKHNVPWFSSSSLRYAQGLAEIRKDPKVGELVGADAWGPCALEEHHPDLFWYGVHGVEILYTVMGTGCETVSRVQTGSTELVTGVWKDGRVGTFRGIRAPGKGDYGAVVFGSKGIVQIGKYDGYAPLVKEIAKFFKGGAVPVSNEETLELFAYMEAADESKRQGGRPVKVADVVAKAREEAGRKIGK